MDVLTAILGTILVMLGLIVFSFKKAFDVIALDAKAAYQRAGRIWLIGGFVQGKIRKFIEDFCEEIFKDEPEEKKEKVKQHFVRLRYGTDAEKFRKDLK